MSERVGASEADPTINPTAPAHTYTTTTNPTTPPYYSRIWADEATGRPPPQRVGADAAGVGPAVEPPRRACVFGGCFAYRVGGDSVVGRKGRVHCSCLEAALRWSGPVSSATLQSTRFHVCLSCKQVAAFIERRYQKLNIPIDRSVAGQACHTLLCSFYARQLLSSPTPKTHTHKTGTLTPTAAPSRPPRPRTIRPPSPPSSVPSTRPRPPPPPRPPPWRSRPRSRRRRRPRAHPSPRRRPRPPRGSGRIEAWAGEERASWVTARCGFGWVDGGACVGGRRRREVRVGLGARRGWNNDRRTTKAKSKRTTWIQVSKRFLV